MSRLLLTFLLAGFITKYSDCQKIEVFGGYNKNTFYDFSDDPHFSSSYTSGYGYSFGAGIDSFRRKGLKHSMNHRITISYDNYSGELINKEVWLGGHSSVTAKVNKSILSIGFFPINFRFNKVIDFNFGFEYSRLTHEKVTGIADQGAWTPSNWAYTHYLENDGRFSAKSYIGLKARIALDFKVWKSYSITPQYLFYLGSWDFVKYSIPAHSARHLFCLGIKRRI